MTKKVKAGTYWRQLSRDHVVIRLVESGLDTEALLVRRMNDSVRPVAYVRLADSLSRWYRCKKDGSWFGAKQTDAQRRNRELLSLEWQLKGAVANMKSALQRHGKLGNHWREIERQAEFALMWMKSTRQIEIARMKSQARKKDSK